MGINSQEKENAGCCCVSWVLRKMTCSCHLFLIVLSQRFQILTNQLIRITHQSQTTKVSCCWEVSVQFMDHWIFTKSTQDQVLFFEAFSDILRWAASSLFCNFDLWLNLWYSRCKSKNYTELLCITSGMFQQSSIHHPTIGTAMWSHLAEIH